MSTGERISRLEGSYEHLATKADLTELKVLIAGLEGELEAFMWGVAVVLALLQIGSTIWLSIKKEKEKGKTTS